MPIVFFAALFVLVTDVAERARVLHGVSASFLTGPCPQISSDDEPQTWVEVDELQARMHALGLFVPGDVFRVPGSFTRAGAVETLYTFEVHECVATGAREYVDIVYDTQTTTRVALVRTSQWSQRGVPSTRRAATGIDEVSFVPREWLHLSSATRWSR
jgi:hypothetical protein